MANKPAGHPEPTQDQRDAVALEEARSGEGRALLPRADRRHLRQVAFPRETQAAIDRGEGRSPRSSSNDGRPQRPPRTGMPELFRTAEDYETYVAKLAGAGIISDASYIWWAMRPSAAHPTLELRAPDCCTPLGDTAAIAALYRSLARRVFLNPSLNADLTAVSRALIVESKWRAQRYAGRGLLAGARRRSRRQAIPCGS
jgi:hypothetical protein